MAGVVGTTAGGALQTLVIRPSEGDVVSEGSYALGMQMASAKPLAIERAYLASRKVGEYGKAESLLYRCALTLLPESMQSRLGIVLDSKSLLLWLSS